MQFWLLTLHQRFLELDDVADTQRSDVCMANLKMDTPPLFMSRDLKEVGGRAKAVHRNALAMDL